MRGGKDLPGFGGDQRSWLVNGYQSDALTVNTAGRGKAAIFSTFSMPCKVGTPVIKKYWRQD